MTSPRTALRTSCGLRVRVADGVAWLTLNRPKAGNRITPMLAQELCRAAADIEEDDAIIVVVLGAAGASFCLGVDGGGDWERHVDWVDAIGQLTCPVIAAIQGDAVAEGLELALACDLRFASDRACFTMPQLYSGRLPSHGGTQRLPRTVGRTRALDLLLTGRRLTASEAELSGLVSRVMAHRRFAGELRAAVRTLAAKGPIALRYAKEAILKGTDLVLDQGIRLEEDLYVLLQTTADRRAGIEAFIRKRAPAFRGN